MFSEFIQLFQETGALAPLIVLLAAAACSVAGVLALVGASGRRIPAPLWLVLPLAAAGMGGLATIYGCTMATRAIKHVAPDQQTMIAHAGLSEALGGFNLGFGGAGFALLLGAGLASLASLTRNGPETRWRLGSSQIGGVIGILGALGIFGFTIADKDPRAALGICLVLLLVSFATLISGIRQSEASLESTRQVSSTLSIGLLAVGTVAAFAARSGVSGWSTYLHGLVQVAPDQRLAVATGSLVDAANAAWFGSIAVGVAAIMGLVSVSKHGARLMQRGVLVEVAVSGLLALGMLGVVGLFLSASAPLRAWTQLGRYHSLGEIAKNLPSTALPDGLYGGGGDWSGPIALSANGGWSSADGAPLALGMPEGPDTLVLALAPTAPLAPLLDTHWFEVGPRGGVASLTLLASRSSRPDVPALIRDAMDALRIEGVEILVPARGSAGASWLADWGRAARGPLLVADRSVAPQDFVGLALRPGAEAAAVVANAVKDRGARGVVFVPGAQWTVQDLVTLCLAASGAAPQMWDREESEPPFACVLSREVPSYADTQVGPDGAAPTSGEVALGDPIVLGAIDASDIIARVHADLGAIAACRSQGGGDTARGKVAVKFVISKTGEVTSAVVKLTTLNNAAVESCVVARFAAMRFPEPKGGGIAIVSFPVLF